MPLRATVATVWFSRHRRGIVWKFRLTELVNILVLVSTEISALRAFLSACCLRFTNLPVIRRY